ncbi:LamG-like jellyroll fold domain-containing protein [Arthrobacter sp. RAF14]|uniref:LamG-like jellyroll fold domain-containing protein n=1 Tax=Arthrobacter sp. RAF14 TaxID=3233051 RepID=UPI003F8FBDA3
MSAETSRRAVIIGSLAGAAALTIPTAASAAATPEAEIPATGQGADGRGTSGGRTFTLAVIPDTQYLFDGDSLHPEPLEATVAWLSRLDDLAFVAHLGDVTQNGRQREFAAAAGPFNTLKSRRIPFSVLAGNHDVDSHTDDRRGPTPFLGTFADLAVRNRISRDQGGYNTAYTFSACGHDFLLIALDWRVSDQGLGWAREVLQAHAQLPTIITVHDAVDTDGATANLSEHGQRIWDSLIKDNPQVFLSINGHFWPSGRMSKPNSAGQPVELHLANYQETYYGGAAAVRLYRFDLDRGVVDVSTEVPFSSQHGLNQLEREELRMTGVADRFSFPVPPSLRDRPSRPTRPAAALLVRGTEAYWRFDGQGPLTRGSRIEDHSGRGNHLEVVGDGSPTLSRVTERHPLQPAGESLRFAGSGKTGGYLLTVDKAPLNSASLDRGYTFEAFFKLPEPFTAGAAWSALFSRWGSAASAGRFGGDQDEPVATLSVSGGRELQWCVYPTNLDRSVTNWGHELRTDRWWHVAVVNNGRRTTMYIDGCPVVRNPSTVNAGLLGGSRGPGMKWAVGGYSWNGELDKTWMGTIGDIRVVSRPLQVREFMIS